LFIHFWTLELICKMVHGAPQCWAWALSHFLFSSFDLEHHCIDLFFYAQNFGSFGFFLCPPALYGNLRWLKFFFYAPQYCLGTFIVEDFLCPPVLFGHFQSLRIFWHLPPSVGCDPSQGYFQKNTTTLKRGLQMIYFSLVRGLSKMAFLHLKCMHLGSVSLTFMRVCRVISHYSCNQNSAFGVTSLCCFFLVF